MPFQLSPGVNVSEVDLTTIIPSVATTDGAFVGQFNWGPLDEVSVISNQESLIRTFGKPNNNVAEYWFTASNFLDYGNRLHVVRTADSDVANNAREDLGSTGLLIKNRENYYDGTVTTTSLGKFAARYPGERGNHILVSICDSHPGQFQNVVTRDTANTIAGSKTIYLNANTNFNVGDVISFRGSVADDIAGSGATVVSDANAPVGDYKILQFNEGTAATAHIGGASYGGVTCLLNAPVPTSANNVAIDRKWEFNNHFNTAPGTSTFAVSRNSANDEIHIAIADATGGITGTKGQLLEAYPNVSKAADARQEDGTSNYYVDRINNTSSYVWWLNHPIEASELVNVNGPGNARGYGNNAFIPDVAVIESFMSIKGGDTRAASGPHAWKSDSKQLQGGNNGFTVAGTSAHNSTMQLGYDNFKDSEKTDISLVLGGPNDGTISRYVVETIAEGRKDCVAFISPNKSDTSNGTLTQKLANVQNFRNENAYTGGGASSIGINSLSSSYGVLDSGWKYQYDKFNDVYRWIPLNGDVAGLCARTDDARDPWWSPAGLNRGQIKNVIKLAWNPQKAERDGLYKNAINPVVNIAGQGTVLFGDKTLLTKPSAFDRINVRRLFIVLEKAIATAAKFTLFEFNDEFTRSQFRNMVEPFLRDVQGRRGIYDFRVVCDETNNTGEVIDRNEFVGDIYIKPARSINFIQLNFVAVRTGVDFEEVVGSF